MRKTRLAAVMAVAAVVVLGGQRAHAHCQVPCGIYDDAARLDALREDVLTIDKAVKAVTDLVGKGDALSFNQAVRWVETKEQHATHIMTTVAEYFLAQKVKAVAVDDPGRAAYLAMLADHHAVLRAAMKVKQGVSSDDVNALRAAVETLAGHYGGAAPPAAKP